MMRQSDCVAPYIFLSRGINVWCRLTTGQRRCLNELNEDFTIEEALNIVEV